jgi:hypothetical protein
MGFILKEDVIYVHCKLTDEGRKKISQGKFNPTKFSVGDSEVNYKYFNDFEFNIEDTKVLSPIDRYKNIKHTIKANNEDQDDKYNIIVNSPQELIYYRDVDDIGFFNGVEYNHETYKTSQYIKQGDFRIDISTLTTTNNKILNIRKTSSYGQNIQEPEIGDYILINWINPLITTENFVNGEVNANIITPFLWYKIIEIDGLLSNNTIEITVDRNLPNFGTDTPSGQFFSYGIIYPKYNSMEYFYNSNNISDYWELDALNFTKNCNLSPIPSNIWNMNILHIDDIIGLTNISIEHKNQPSVKYAGFLTYITNELFEYNNIGIIHYTNNNPINLYGEKFEDVLSINLPTILWHKNEDNLMGLELYSDGDKKYFENYEVEYYNLIDKWNNILGIIFSELKIIIITDQELLYAMSYKSNRNWTLAKPLANFNLSSCDVDDIGQLGTFYYGTYEVLGSLVDIPTATDIDIFSGTIVNSVNLFTYSLNIPFNSGDNDFIWVAIPSAFPIRTKWYVNIFNRGDIGGNKIISGNLFPDPEGLTINGIQYTIYISNYRTKAETINLLLN